MIKSITGQFDLLLNYLNPEIFIDHIHSCEIEYKGSMYFVDYSMVLKIFELAKKKIKESKIIFVSEDKNFLICLKDPLYEYAKKTAYRKAFEELVMKIEVNWNIRHEILKKGLGQS